MVELKNEEKPIDVVVYDTVGPKLAQHLEEVGRPSYTPMQLQQRIQQTVWRRWGVQAQRFQDEHGGGWLVETTDALDGMETYAVVRSIHGTRMVTAVVELEELEQFRQTGRWETPEANGLDHELVAAMAEIEGNPPAAPGRPGLPTRPMNGTSGAAVRAPVHTEPDPNEPRLILYFEVPEGGGDEVGPPQVMRATHETAQQKVLPLLMRGCKVEVWSGQKVPTIKVDL